MNLSTGYLSTNTVDGVMDIYFCHPEMKNKKYPVVMVLQEAFGVNQHIKDICQRLAHEGYAVFAPDLFHRIERKLEIDYSDRKAIMPLLSQITDQDLMEDLKATFKVIYQHASCDRAHISAIGFCMGGYTSVLAATILPLESAVSFYGAGMVNSRDQIGFGPLIGHFDEIECPIFLIYGAADPSITKEERLIIEKNLRAKKKKFRMQVFPDCNHGFFCNERSAYHPQAAQTAWELTLSWLRDHQAPKSALSQDTSR